jgi:hypothetical protein
LHPNSVSLFTAIEPLQDSVSFLLLIYAGI